MNCFKTLLPNTLILFVEKMSEACNAKASHIFSTKITGCISDINI